LLEARELSEAEISGLFGAARHGVETGEDGRLLSFFTGERRHVVLKAKETLILRPHGHILRTGSALLADEAALTSTAWMCGVFHSMCTQGHVSINRFLSTHRSYLGLYRSHGLRLFVRQVEGWRLLDLPSAFEMAPEGCRWIYRHGEGLLEVRAGAATDRHELTLEINVLSGSPLQVLLTAHLAVNGDDGAEAVPARVDPDGAGVLVRAIPESDLGRRFPEGGFYLGPRPDTLILQRGGDELLFGDGDSRGQPVVCFVAAPALSLGFSILGRLVPEPHPDAAAPTADRYWRAMTAGLRLAPPADSPLAEDARCLADILPWFVHNGLVHYLSPRGLEQYSGGGWGARDVTQGPVELLLGLGRPEPIRDILRKVFRQQNPDGDWPQWFMFFERERNIRPNDSHGDIVFWPVLALGQYLVAADDPDLLDEEVPFFHPEGEAAAERASFWGHVERALGVIERRAIPGTRLAAYGHGDWNDSLQPADPSFRDSLCSSWTVTLHYRTLHFLAAALRKLGREEPAARLETWAAAVLADFQKLLVADGVLAGFAHFGGEGVRYLLHPEDRDTGLSYSLLPMIHAIIDGLFSPGQARHHLGLIERELLGPDGARLFDRPMAYRGGPQRFFQRAESSSFFGREIGLMYMHAHLRYAEALWQFGDAEGFFRALRLAVPIGLEAHVPSAARRQANCYYSSSDAAFRDRYQAHDEYGLCLSGEIPLEGGWRVYSSGAGISTGLIFRCFLGMRAEASRLVIDPAVPKELDGLKAELELRGIRFEVTYRVEGQGCGPVALELNGRDLPFTRLSNPYRPGGAEVAMDAIRAGVLEGVNLLTVRLG
jgi:cellobiose phosphorylase